MSEPAEHIATATENTLEPECKAFFIPNETIDSLPYAPPAAELHRLDLPEISSKTPHGIAVVAELVLRHTAEINGKSQVFTFYHSRLLGAIIHQTSQLADKVFYDVLRHTPSGKHLGDPMTIDPEVHFGISPKALLLEAIASPWPVPQEPCGSTHITTDCK